MKIQSELKVYFMTRLPKNQKSRNNTDVANKIKISIVFLLWIQVRLNWVYRQYNASKKVTNDTDMVNM